MRTSQAAIGIAPGEAIVFSGSAMGMGQSSFPTTRLNEVSPMGTMSNLSAGLTGHRQSLWTGLQKWVLPEPNSLLFRRYRRLAEFRAHYADVHPQLIEEGSVGHWQR